MRKRRSRSGSRAFSGFSARVAARIALFGLLGAGLAYLAFANAFSNVTHRGNPRLALRFTPDDPVALTGLAAIRIARDQNLRDPAITALARQSLTELAINPAALRLIGLMASADGGLPAGRRAMLLADRMSRRDTATQLWLIEEAVARNDIPGALQRYDNALRVAGETQQVLFPVLTAALEDPQISDSFIPYIREPTPWLGDFVRHAVRNSRRPAAYAALFMRAGGLPRDPVFASLEQELIKRLIDTDASATAARYYGSLQGADRRVLRSAAFSDRSVDTRFVPLTWEIFTLPGLNAAFVRSGSDALALQGLVEAGGATPVARKVVLVPAGTYRFRARQGLIGQGGTAEATWQLLCSGGNSAQPVWSRTDPLVAQRRAVEASLNVPARCYTPMLRLLVTATGSSAEFTIQSVSLEPAA
jgi:hypothetical protein